MNLPRDIIWLTDAPVKKEETKKVATPPPSPPPSPPDSEYEEDYADLVLESNAEHLKTKKMKKKLVIVGRK